MIATWKVLAAAFAGLFAVSVFLMGMPHLSTLLNNTGEWNMPQLPAGLLPDGAATGEVKVIVYPDGIFTLNPSTPVNITTLAVSMEYFTGEVSADFSSGQLMLRPSGSRMVARVPLSSLTLSPVSVPSLDLKEAKFVVSSGSWNMTTENSTLSMTGFMGSVLVERDSITFEGNASSVKGDKWEIK